MSKTLIVSFLPREGSNTKKIVDAFIAAAGDKTEIIERRLDEVHTPLITKAAMATWWGPEGDNEAEIVSAELIAELKGADNVVIAAPMYNLGVPAPVKAWIDLIARAGQTFEYTAEGPRGLLDIKNAALIETTGGMPVGSPADFMTGHVKMMLQFIGAGEVAVVSAEGLNQVDDQEAAAKVIAAQKAATELATKWFN